MSKKKHYWITKDGRKINVDDMTKKHLKNILKMIIKNKYSKNIEQDENLEPYCDDYMWK